jgi:hypothetical protein
MIRVSSSVPAGRRPPRGKPFAVDGRTSAAAAKDPAPTAALPLRRYGTTA